MLKDFKELVAKVDCARNAVPTVESMKHFFDMIAKMGYTHVALLVQDNYQLDDEPYFGYKRGGYTQAQLRELDDYAASVGLEMFLQIQTLAHLGPLFRWPQYAEINDCDDMLLVGDDKTYELIEKMLVVADKCLRSRKLYIAMDEAYRAGSGKYCKLHGYHPVQEVFLEHLNRICEMAKKYHFEVILSADMFFRFQAGTYFDGAALPPHEIVFSEDIRNKVPKDVSIIYWDYNGREPEKYEMMLRAMETLTDKDHIIFQGSAGWSWCSLTPRNRLAMNNMKIALQSCRNHGIERIYFSTFGDNGAEVSLFAALPSFMEAAALACGMSEDEKKKKFKEITGEDFDDMLLLDLPNRIYGEDVDVGAANFSKTRLFNDPFLGIYDRNTKKAIDDVIFSEYGKRLHDAAGRAGDFAYLFETQAVLCDVLTNKFNLGIRTRAIYEAGDKEALRKLAEVDYTNAINALEVFYRAFRTQWYRDNGSNGFEIQDVRVGGLLCRMRNCREMLMDYCAGKTKRIAELEEPVLEFNSALEHNWYYMVSANRFNDN